MKKLICIFLLPFVLNAQSPFIKSCENYIKGDEWKHCTAGAFVGSSVYFFTYRVNERIGLSAGISELATYVVGQSKEIYDNRQGGSGYSFRDNLNTFGRGGPTGIFFASVSMNISERKHDERKIYKSAKKIQ